MTTIKIKVKDRKGNVIAYHNNCETIGKALELKEKWLADYNKAISKISIHFIND